MKERWDTCLVSLIGPTLGTEENSEAGTSFPNGEIRQSGGTGMLTDADEVDVGRHVLLRE